MTDPKKITFQFGTGKEPVPVPKDAVIVAPDSLVQPKWISVEERLPEKLRMCSLSALREGK